MNEESDLEPEIQEALDKAEDILSGHMEAGIIIGTFRDADGHTRKWSQSWGNEFAVSKIVETEVSESQMVNSICRHYEEED